jgi:hypothetical protein
MRESLVIRSEEFNAESSFLRAICRNAIIAHSMRSRTLSLTPRAPPWRYLMPARFFSNRFQPLCSASQRDDSSLTCHAARRFKSFNCSSDSEVSHKVNRQFRSRHHGNRENEAKHMKRKKENNCLESLDCAVSNFAVSSCAGEDFSLFI